MAGGRAQGPTSLKTVFLIDGDFFLRRLRNIRGLLDAEQVVFALNELCSLHLIALSRDASFLCRVFFYDCPPLDKKIHQPVSKVSLDLGKSASYRFRTALHERLKMTDNVALRLGELSDEHGHWVLRRGPQKDLLSGKLTVADLKDSHFDYDVDQKGVDMRIGLDLASIAAKRLADQVVLVAGDSDFIPAAKMARR